MSVSLDDFRRRFNGDVGEHRFVVVVCRCGIEYWGRSRSVIDCGERVVLVKPDSTLIVHSVSGFKPVNWMGAPTDTLAELSGGRTVVYSQRTRPPYEEMKITVETVLDYQSYGGLRDTKVLELSHTEKDMRDYLAANPRLVDPDFRLKSVEYRSPLGFFDLYGQIGGRNTVVELKSERAGLPAALQVKRYRDWLCEHLKEDCGGMLIAPSVTPNALRLLNKEKIAFKKFDIKPVKRPRGRKHTLHKWVEGD